MTTITALFLLALVVVYARAASFSKASYGENCTKEVRCDSRKFLSCSNGQCECLMPDTMIHDSVSGKCVALAGERCQYSTTEAEKSWTEELPCIANARCQNGVCECNPNFYEVSNGTCLQKRDYGADCVSDEMCNDNKHLVCGAAKTCTCLSGRLLEEGMCKILAGQFCPSSITDDSICVFGASCQNSTVCKCESTDFFQTENGTCELKRGLGNPCSNDVQCKSSTFLHFPNFAVGMEIPSFLNCVQGTCQCNHRISVQTTDHFQTYCAKYLHQPCNQHECFQGATCSGTCQCQSLNFETSNQTCEPKKLYGSDCESNEHCISGLRCDPVRKKCACESGYGFSSTVNRCVLAPNQKCRSNYYNYDIKECVPNARCDQIDSSGYDYQCRCVADTKESNTGDGLCYALEDKSCNGDTFSETTSRQCWPGLTCRNGKCVCPYKDHQKFDESSSKCYSLIGGPCNKTDECQDKNAECALRNNVRQCLCKNGFTQSDRQCDLAYGEKCEQGGNPICDRYGPLECTGRKICECSDFQIYDNETLSCRGLVGAKCKVTVEPVVTKNFCIGGASCKPFRGFESVFGLCECQPGWDPETDRTCYVPKRTENVIDTEKPLKDAAAV